MRDLIGAIFLILWIAGFVIAKGFWSTVACIFAPYSFYLVIELAMNNLSLI